MNKTALTLIIIGALNWLLIGLFRFDLVATIFGGQAGAFSRIIYIIVGIAGIWAFSFWRKVAKDSSFEEETIKDNYQSRVQLYNNEFSKEYKITDNQGSRSKFGSKSIFDDSQNNNGTGKKD